MISYEILSRLDSDDLEICVDCVKGKLTKTKKNGATRNQNLLEIVPTNISGPYSTTLCGNKYFITFIDDFSRYGYVYLIKEKTDALEMFKVFRTEVEKQLYSRPKKTTREILKDTRLGWLLKGIHSEKTLIS